MADMAGALRPFHGLNENPVGSPKVQAKLREGKREGWGNGKWVEPREAWHSSGSEEPPASQARSRGPAGRAGSQGMVLPRLGLGLGEALGWEDELWGLLART